MAGAGFSNPSRMIETLIIVNQCPLMAVISTDRRNTIILTEVDGVLFNEKKVQARGV